MSSLVTRLVAGVIVSVGLVLGIEAARAADRITILSFAPDQLPRGIVTTLTVQGKGLEQLTAVEVTPAEGITVKAPVQAATSRRKEQRWTIDLEVSADAPEGKREVVLVTPQGRSAPLALRIPDHSPVISDLRVELVQRSPVIVAFTIRVGDEKADLGERPVVASQLVCGNASGEFRADGVITQRVDETTVVVASAHQDYQSRVSAGACVLNVMAIDAKGNLSNQLTTAVKF